MPRTPFLQIPPSNTGLHFLNGEADFLHWNRNMETLRCNGCHFSPNQQTAGAESSISPFTAASKSAGDFDWATAMKDLTPYVLPDAVSELAAVCGQLLATTLEISLISICHLLKTKHVSYLGLHGICSKMVSWSCSSSWQPLTLDCQKDEVSQACRESIHAVPVPVLIPWVFLIIKSHPNGARAQLRCST